MRIKYNEILKIFENENCTLITSEKDIIDNSLNCRSLFKYIAQCTHEREICFSDFKNKGVGRICKLCQYKNTSTKYKQNKNYGIHQGIKIENITTDILLKIFADKIDFHHTYEGCHADFIIRPLNCNENKWLPIQVKGATFNYKNVCRFRHVNNYDKYLMCCIGIKESEFKLWLFNGTICKNYNGVTICPKSITYSKYELQPDNIIDYLLKCYNDIHNYIHITYNFAMTPVSIKCKTEHCNRIKRFEYLSQYLKIIYSNKMNTIYDCIINDLKVQDKSGQKHRFGISFGVNKKHNKKAIPYEKGDIDIYWLYIPDTSKFYIIPEYILIKEGFIKTSNQLGKKCIILFPEQGKRKNNKSWANDYLFDYNNLNIEKIKYLFIQDKT